MNSMTDGSGGTLVINRNGGNTMIGGGTIPSYLLQLETDSAGKPNGGSWTDSCDRRLKKNIRPLTGALDKLSQIQTSIFEWVNPEDHSEGVRASVVADDLEKIFPEWVQEIEPYGKDKEIVPQGKVKSISFPNDFSAHVIEAIKELKAEIDQLKKRKAETGRLKGVQK